MADTESKRQLDNSSKQETANQTTGWKERYDGDSSDELGEQKDDVIKETLKDAIQKFKKSNLPKPKGKKPKRLEPEEPIRNPVERTKE